MRDLAGNALRRPRKPRMLADHARLPAPRRWCLPMTPTRADVASVTTEGVMLAILELTHEDAEARFTTLDVADQLGVREYQVRAAFHWLRRFRKIAVVPGEIQERITYPSGQRYPVTVYRMLPKSTPADFDALYQVFGLRSAAQLETEP